MTTTTQYTVAEIHALRYAHALVLFRAHGIDASDLVVLCRAERVLHRWAERECNGEIQRDEATGIPYLYDTRTGRRLAPAADHEASAIKRVRATIAKTKLTLVLQGDPRGAALHFIDRDGRTLYLPD